MTRAISYIDTAFIEDLTAMTLYQQDKCEKLAESLRGKPEEMQILREIYTKAEKIKLKAFKQRSYLRIWKQEMRKQAKQAGAR